MIDSTNPRQLADNIRKLWDKFKSISGDLLPSRSTATTGQILKLTGENKTPSWGDEYSYTPPAYSTTETATGQKWIDGKEIYKKTFTGTTSNESGNEIIGSIDFNTIVDFKMIFLRTDGFYLYTAPIVLIQENNGNVIISKGTSSIYMQTGYIINVYYTKPDPTPGRAPEDQEPEEVTPEEKKTTKKKTTSRKDGE